MDEYFYRVWFENPDGHRCSVDMPQHYGIARVAEGFWLNADWLEATLGQELHWIPPARIVIVTKLRASAGDGNG